MKRYSILDSGGYGHMTVDFASEKLYVSHGSQVIILDKNIGDSFGSLKPKRMYMALPLCMLWEKGMYQTIIKSSKNL